MKTNIFKNALIFLIFLSCNCTCEKDKYHEDVYIKNNSNMSIYYNYAFENYPDTAILDVDHVIINMPDLYKINPNESKRVFLRGRTKWEGIYNVAPLDTVMFFIFDAQVLETTPWDTVQKYYLVLKRYDLSFQDLEQMNWTITYP
jgi:hypothetical protein